MCDKTTNVTQFNTLCTYIQQQQHIFGSNISIFPLENEFMIAFFFFLLALKCDLMSQDALENRWRSRLRRAQVAHLDLIFSTDASELYS